MTGSWFALIRKRLPVTGSRFTLTGSRLCVTGSHLAVTGNQLPVNGSQLPMIGGQLPVTGNRLPMIGGQLPVNRSQLPMIGERVPVTGNRLPMIAGHLPATGNQIRVSENRPGLRAIPVRADVAAGDSPAVPLSCNLDCMRRTVFHATRSEVGDLLAGNLSAEERRRMVQHLLAGCETCAQLVHGVIFPEYPDYDGVVRRLGLSMVLAENDVAVERRQAAEAWAVFKSLPPEGRLL